jgi:allantoicase
MKNWSEAGPDSPSLRNCGPGTYSVALQGHREHAFEITSANVCTHVRLNVYADGGVARFRVYGDP